MLADKDKGVGVVASAGARRFLGGSLLMDMQNLNPY